MEKVKYFRITTYLRWVKQIVRRGSACIVAICFLIIVKIAHTSLVVFTVFLITAFNMNSRS